MTNANTTGTGTGTGTGTKKQHLDDIVTAQAAAIIIYGESKKDKTRSIIKLIKSGALGGGKLPCGQWITSRQQIQRYFEILEFQAKARFKPAGNWNGGKGSGGKNGNPAGKGSSGFQGNSNAIGNDGARAARLDYNATLKAAIDSVHGQHGSNKN